MKLTMRCPGSADATQALHISIVQPSASGAQSVASFNPEFTEQLFGQNQAIFGYRDLAVSIRFAAHDLYPNVKSTWGQKFPPLGKTTATDIEATLKEYLPECEATPYALACCG